MDWIVVSGLGSRLLHLYLMLRELVQPAWEPRMESHPFISQGWDWLKVTALIFSPSSCLLQSNSKSPQWPRRDHLYHVYDLFQPATGVYFSPSNTWGTRLPQEPGTCLHFLECSSPVSTWITSCFIRDPEQRSAAQRSLPWLYFSFLFGTYYYLTCRVLTCLLMVYFLFTLIASRVSEQKSDVCSQL